jgi:hypothetical protein
MLSSPNAIEPPKRHRRNNIAFGPMSLAAQRRRQRIRLQFVVTFLDGARFGRGERDDGNQCLMALGYDYYGAFLDHFGRSESGPKIAD